MKFKEALNQIGGLREMAGSLNLLTAVGRRTLDASEWIVDATMLNALLDEVEEAADTIENADSSSLLEKIRLRLMNVRDIPNTISRLSEGETLDDVELFELKGFALVNGKLREYFESLPLIKFETFRLPDLTGALEELDPEQTGSSNFYIYDSYSEKLALCRKELKKLQSASDYDENESEVLTAECLRLEAEVREMLSQRLRPYARDFGLALERIGKADLVIAKAQFAVDSGLTRPELTTEVQEYRKLWNPVIKNRLKETGRCFQPVDISFGHGLTLITGANMGGKSVTLRSVALAQALAQFGFYVPAAKAQVVPVAEILQSIGDGESEQQGLSSFGAEIVRINSILDKTEKGTCLVLIDEPARTTNPDEGRAIASALAEILNQRESFSLMTTHYSLAAPGCRRLRVRGLRDNLDNTGDFTPGKIAELMDYSLVAETEETDIPHEALRIARLIGGETELIRKASRTLENSIRKK